jgi:type II secretory pathway pseudopilin PulG
MRKIKMKNEKGFSLVESMITMGLFFIILGAVYMMVIHYAEVARTEHSRIRMQQESRFLMTNFTQELQDAGAVLTAIPTFVKDIEQVSFNGLYPLNQTDYPDGFIVAAGDPSGVTYLAEDYSLADAGNFLLVNTVYKITSPDYDATLEYELRPWKDGDKAIIVNKEGYMVFKIKEVGYNDDTTDNIEMRALPVYYSGLLNTQTSRESEARTYIDTNTGTDGITGNTGDPSYQFRSLLVPGYPPPNAIRRSNNPAIGPRHRYQGPCGRIARLQYC